MRKYVTLGDVCKKGSSNIAQKDIENSNGTYAIYGASGYIKDVNFYHQDKPYIAVVKDGAGIGRTMLLPEKTSVIGTLQYLIPNDSISVKYLYYAVTYMNLSKYFTGATIPHIYFKDYQKELLPLPPMEKQLEIARNLEKIDAMIGLCNSIVEKMDVLVKSRFVEMFGDPVENEKAWNTIPLEDACISIVDCPHSTPHYTYENTGYMCIRTSIVKKNRILWDEIEYIPEAEYFQRIKRRKPQKGDIIYTREGAILGIAAVIDRECDVALGQRSMLLSPDTSVCLPEFLSTAMNFDSFLNKVLERVSGSASPHINVGDIRIYNIMMPPIELQNTFAVFVQEIDKSKLAVKECLEKAEYLKSALMQEYFG